jgi:hypothetical protein
MGDQTPQTGLCMDEEPLRTVGQLGTAGTKRYFLRFQYNLASSSKGFDQSRIVGAWHHLSCSPAGYLSLVGRGLRLVSLLEIESKLGTVEVGRWRSGEGPELQMRIDIKHGERSARC